MNKLMSLKNSIVDLIKKTSTELPSDTVVALRRATNEEKEGSSARYAMDIIMENIKLAKDKSGPLCQDTGAIMFFVRHPVGFDQEGFEEDAKNAVIEATSKGYLRQNSVDSLTGKNSGNNLGPGSPSFYFHQWPKKELEVKIILKGGGSENVSAQYSLPYKRLDANRDLIGVRKCILDTVHRAQGQGCGPGILGVCIGGDRLTGYIHAKEQFLRKLDDKNPNPVLAELEEDIIKSSNSLGIGPMGFGGKTTLLGCKIGVLNRHPASYFVTVSYMCWAARRQGAVLDSNGKIREFLY